MSDIMLNAVIQMPYEMAMKDELSRIQFYERANQALNERNAKAAEIERLREALVVVRMSFAWSLLQKETQDVVNAALSGEPT